MKTTLAAPDYLSRVNRDNRCFKAPFVVFRSWLLPAPGDSKDGGSFITAVALAGVTGRWFRLSATTQRAFFGCVPFGKRAVRVTDAQTVAVRRTISFGLDSAGTVWTAIELAEICRQLRAGTKSPVLSATWRYAFGSTAGIESGDLLVCAW